MECDKLKIRNFRFPCEICGNNSDVSSIQVFFRKDGTVGYARARHLSADKKFYYHQQSLEYVNNKLKELANIEHGQASESKTIEQTDVHSGSKLSSMVGLPGFEPWLSSQRLQI